MTMSTYPIQEEVEKPYPHQGTSFLTDEPNYSSAALCVRLQHSNRTFRPEFTHQCTATESWSGCRPLQKVLSEAIESFVERNKIRNPSKDGIGNNDADIQKHEQSPQFPSSECSLLHKSHEGHITATTELDIQVILSPSCRRCRVNIHKTPIVDKEDQQSNPKRMKFDDPSSVDIVSIPDLDMTSNTRHNSAAAAVAAVTPTVVDQCCISDDDILKSLSHALPDIVSDNNDDGRAMMVEDDYLLEPFGVVLDEYSVDSSKSSNSKRSNDNNNNNNDTNNFVLTVADGRSSSSSSSSTSDLVQYHNSIQRLALLYIENADDVDISDTDNGGFWKVLYVFQKHDHNDPKEDFETRHDGAATTRATTGSPYRYSLVGYYTLFHFHALFHKPHHGLIVRICQALILPPYQGQGHGQRLLQTVYNMAHHRHHHGSVQYDMGTIHYGGDHPVTSNIVQVNVEDPAPGFVALRNKVDLAMVQERGKEWNWPGECEDDTSASRQDAIVEDDSYFSTLTDQQVLELSCKAKIIPRQIHIVNELLKLSALLGYSHRRRQHDQSESSSSSNTGKRKEEEVETKFRLLVKRRLNKELSDEMSVSSTKEEKKVFLADAYEVELKNMRRLVESSSGSRKNANVWN